jgi:hypothetical protein
MQQIEPISPGYSLTIVKEGGFVPFTIGLQEEDFMGIWNRMCLERWVTDPVVVPQNSRPLEAQMSKRKPGKASKPARSPTIAARAHGKQQAVARSAKDNLSRSVAAGPIDSPLEIRDDPKQEATNVQKQETLDIERREAPISASPMQNGLGQMRGLASVSATGTMVAYQMKLIELTQAHLQFAFDFSQKITTIRSPFQLADVIVEFTKRRAVMLDKQSAEMVALIKG